MKGDAALNLRVLRVFEDLLDRPPASWAKWLEETCADEPAVRDAVRAMVDAHRSGGVIPTAPPEPRATAEDAPAPSRVGQYRILSELGRGGMGVVYLAERADGLFDHRVAIKLIRQTSLSERARATFATERQILARLRHPHIAQMHDGGATEAGAPYMVMECIAGAPITEHCAAKQVDLRGRLALFAEACGAIEFAHRNLVVHADIKPSNVVVEDGFGVKLLDFGVARLLDDLGPSGSGGHTRGYASPARIAGAPATPADDVYSAGVLLRELIADQPGVDDDLRAIVSKAAADDETRRYGAMSELSDDLARWIANRPVLAAPAGRRRRALLFWRRHRVSLSAAGALGVTLVVGLAIVLALYLQGERRRALADQRYAAVRQMSAYIIDDLDPGLAHVPGTLATRERLLRRTGAYLSQLASDQDASPALKREIAAAYLRIAKVYGLDPSGGIEDFPAAEASLALANRLLDEAAVAEPDAPELWKLRGQAKLLRAEKIFLAPSTTEAMTSLAAATTAQAMLRRYLRQVPNDTDARLALWTAEIVPGRGDAYLGRPSAGLPAIERDLGNVSLPVQTRTQRSERENNLDISLLLLGEGYYDARQYAKSRPYFDKLIDRIGDMQARGASDWKLDTTHISGLHGRSALEVRTNDVAGAVRDDREAIKELRRLYLVNQTPMIGVVRSFIESFLANNLARLHRFAEARQTSDESLAWLEREVARHSGHPAVRRALFLATVARASLEDQADSPVTACRAARDAVALSRVSALRADTAPDGPMDKTGKLIAKDCGTPPSRS